MLWLIEQNTGDLATLSICHPEELANSAKKEIKRPENISREHFLAFFTPGNVADESCVNLFND